MLTAQEREELEEMADETGDGRLRQYGFQGALIQTDPLGGKEWKGQLDGVTVVIWKRVGSNKEIGIGGRGERSRAWGKGMASGMKQVRWFVHLAKVEKPTGMSGDALIGEGPTARSAITSAKDAIKLRKSRGGVGL